MDICHIGQSSINFPNVKRDLLLKDVLHVPQANKNLASMSRLSADNNIFFETHPKYFFSLRIGQRGSSSITVDASVVYILSHQELLAASIIVKSTPSSNHPSRGGIKD